MKLQSTFLAMVMALGLFAVATASRADWNVEVSVGIPPPALPVYAQPTIPAPGYLWTPGYWAFSAEDEDYFWVPGTWVLAPRPGYLWTPGYWAADGARFTWNAGYWGPEVGFYGGINYGFGYFGIGFGGGYWRGDEFCYNRAVTNVNNVSITNVYNNTTIVNNQVSSSRVSYNGGRNGIQSRPSDTDRVIVRGPHLWATNEQLRHESVARLIPVLRAASNHGQPPVAATPTTSSLARLGRETGSARDVPAARDRPHVPSARARLQDGAQVGTRSYRAATSGANSNVRPSPSQFRPSADPARAIRPTWADRGSAQDRSGPVSGYSLNARADRSATGATVQRWTAPNRSEVDHRFPGNLSRAPIGPQRAATPPREYGRLPPSSAPNRPANTGSPRPYAASHAADVGQRRAAWAVPNSSARNAGPRQGAATKRDRP